MTHHNPTWRDPEAWLKAVRASSETPPALKFDSVWGVYPPMPTSAFRAASKWAAEAEALIRQNPHLSVETVLKDHVKEVGCLGGVRYVLKRHWVYGGQLDAVVDAARLEKRSASTRVGADRNPTQHIVVSSQPPIGHPRFSLEYPRVTSSGKPRYSPGDYVRANGVLYRVGMIPFREPTLLYCAPAHLERAWDKEGERGRVSRADVTDHWPVPRVFLPTSSASLQGAVVVHSVRKAYESATEPTCLCVADSRVWKRGKVGGWTLLGSAATTPIPEGFVQCWPPAALRAEIEQQAQRERDHGSFTCDFVPACPTNVK